MERPVFGQPLTIMPPPRDRPGRPIPGTTSPAFRPVIVAILAVVFCGCPAERQAPQPRAESSPADRGPLRLRVVDDPDLAEAIGRQWQSGSTGELSVEEVSLAEILEPAGQTQRRRPMP